MTAPDATIRHAECRLLASCDSVDWTGRYQQNIQFCARELMDLRSSSRQKMRFSRLTAAHRYAGHQRLMDQTSTILHNTCSPPNLLPSVIPCGVKAL